MVLGQVATLVAIGVGITLGYSILGSFHVVGDVARPSCRLCVGQRIQSSSATSDEWRALPGIGEKTATNIANYSKNVRPIRSRSDLLQVKGVGVKTLARIEAFIEFESHLDNTPHSGIIQESHDLP